MWATKHGACAYFSNVADQSAVQICGFGITLVHQNENFRTEDLKRAVTHGSTAHAFRMDPSGFLDGETRRQSCGQRAAPSNSEHIAYAFELGKKCAYMSFPVIQVLLHRVSRCCQF